MKVLARRSACFLGHSSAEEEKMGLKELVVWNCIHIITFT